MVARIVGIVGLFWIVAGFSAAPSQQPSWAVSGTIVDESGKPLPEAELTRYFLYTHGKFFAYEPLKTDAVGAFKGTITPYKLPMVYLAMDKERKLGARVTLTEESIRRPVRIVLKPLAEVSFKEKIENGYEPASMVTSIGCMDPATVVLMSYDPGPYPIPEGAYDLRFGSQELMANHTPFTVKSSGKLDLGACAVGLTPIARNVGKTAMPLDFAEARGVPPNFKLRDLKGKWVLMEFWGFW